MENLEGVEEFRCLQSERLAFSCYQNTMEQSEQQEERTSRRLRGAGTRGGGRGGEGEGGGGREGELPS